MAFLKKMVKGAKNAMGDSTDKGGYDQAYSPHSNVVGSGQTFLHGYLIIHIREAKNIPDMENWYSKIYDKKDVTDPFVDVKLGKARIAKTAVIDNDLNPTWNETFRIEVCHKADTLVFDVRDKDHAYTEEIGVVEISTQHLINGQVIEDWFPIKKGSKENGHLSIKVEYISMVQIGATYEVDSYFRMHRGCSVTLYQDTCCPTDLPWLNMVQGPNNTPPTHNSCWKDLYYSLEGAQNIICITGWSVWTKLRLFRGEEAVSIYGGTLGELLCRKADQGVEVKIMVWSEKTSGEWVGDAGMMNTHDMETYKYFKDGKNYRTSNRVIAALAPRELGDTKEFTDMLQTQFSAGMYTHHQKMVVVDTDDPYQPDGRRKLVAYVGGLDLTGGRYDNPEHSLFATLKTDHLDDFRNSNAKGTSPSVGPREPWHDIHSRVEGPIAKDVLENFIERWKMQGLKESQPPVIDDHFCRKVNPEAVAVQADISKEWNVQLFRSITSDSAVLDVSHMERLVLTSKKGRVVEQSITQAYIQMIRHAQNFIYIENQYFMGSAFQWLEDSGTNCNHTIPVELATKICNKMFAGERFTAYVVIPMWPEGDPTSAPMQAILYWQTRTIEMMYREVGKALKQANVPPHLGQHPTDWLLFLCPGKRELYGSHIDVLDPPPPGSLAETFRSTMRQMIYVHSKMMIVDDSYIICGSANINERSMAGTRDTEMAVGCWQPQFNAYNPYGDVHMFRMSLWAEHLKTWEEQFRFPGTLDCTARIKEMCWFNWQSYNFEKYGLPQEELPPGQLLLYPIKVEQNGEIGNLPDFKSFPDYPSSAKVFGSKSAMIPEKVTT
eukprot:GFUD01029568.1.p1 GENE.GFUD01029568.1~~GFUD01029568.1.p1  ORF type:complete len:832 (-),score=202.16 GFUD01029568.1:287-2782(-)